MTIQELLEALSRNEQRARELADMRRAILANLESAIQPGDAVTFAGYQAQWKPGRKSTDHEAAAIDYAVEPSIIEKHTTVKTSIAWAKVTKEAKLPKDVLDRYTTEAPPTFSVEPMK